MYKTCWCRIYIQMAKSSILHLLVNDGLTEHILEARYSSIGQIFFYLSRYEMLITVSKKSNIKRMPTLGAPFLCHSAYI